MKPCHISKKHDQNWRMVRKNASCEKIGPSKKIGIHPSILNQTLSILEYFTLSVHVKWQPLNGESSRSSSAQVSTKSLYSHFNGTRPPILLSRSRTQLKSPAMIHCLIDETCRIKRIPQLSPMNNLPNPQTSENTNDELVIRQVKLEWITYLSRLIISTLTRCGFQRMRIRPRLTSSKMCTCFQ